MTYLRIELCVGDKFYYDIGLRKHGNQMLPKTFTTMGEKHPRFLEDFIEKYGRKNVKIVDYGKLHYEKEYIDKILE